LKARTWLIAGVVAIVPALSVGLVTASWDWFVLICIATGVALGIGASIVIQGEAPPRSPEENLRQMKANQYGYVAGLEVPTEVRSWRPVLIGVPAFLVGVVAFVIVASTR
jgi:hypothetical protein